MKIEFIKETKIDGSLLYYTKVNGCYVDGTLEFDLEKAKQRYNHIIETKSIKSIETVLESVEI